MTRRELIGQGFLTGGATVLSTGLFSLFANPRAAFAAARERLAGRREPARLRRRPRGHEDPVHLHRPRGRREPRGLERARRQGRPARPARHAVDGRLQQARLAGRPGPGRRGNGRATATSNGDHTDTSLGLAFHSDSAFLRGMQASFKTAGIAASINGAVIPARSENDTATIRTIRSTASSAPARRARSSR